MNRIKELRELDGMTQTELGEYLDVQAAAVSKYENGDVALTAEIIKNLCKIFNVSSDYLLHISDEYDNTSDQALKNDEPSPGTRIKTLRQSRQMNQAELAELLQVQHAAVSKYERDKLNLSSDNLIQLSKIFNVSIDYILCQTDNPWINIKKSDFVPVGFEKASSISAMDQKIKNIYKDWSEEDKKELLKILKSLAKFINSPQPEKE
jgi:transcriptional regulator with XRE-family HTH domain